MIQLSAAAAAIEIDPSNGCLSAVRLGKSRQELTRLSPAGFLEVEVLRTGRAYNPLQAAASLSQTESAGGDGARKVEFRRQYDDAPFAIAETFTETKAGVRWEAVLRLLPGQTDNRSVKVTFVLPAPGGWKFWAPQDTHPFVNDGVTPRHYVYGHVSFRPFGTMIPLAGLWNDKAALVAFSPPDIQKPYMTFDLHTQGAPASVRGIAETIHDVPQLRIAYQHVGLRPGKELRLAICLAAAQPDWRCVLGHYVRCYPELFEVIPQTRPTEGMYAITSPHHLERDNHLPRMKKAGVTFAEIHGHFFEYSVFMEPEALTDPNLTWTCRPHPTPKKLSLADNRMWIERLKAAGIAPFMYFYNCHALPDTIERRWPGATMRDELGQPLLKWYTEPSVWGPPDSPYGRHVFRQMELMLQAYPQTTGFFIDNYAIEMYDFAHDDGVTMIHDRPVYDLNRNHQLLGPPCFRTAHRQNKVVMVNKISTIESLDGADMCLAETQGTISVQKHALACVFRPLFPLAMELPEGPHPVERGLQHLLLNGCIPDDDLYHKDPRTMTAYRPLTDALIGKRWVLDFDPLDTPAGLSGQVFRIDPAAAHAGDVVVVLADLHKSYTDRKYAKGLSVTIRLPEAGRLRKAAWLPVEKSAAKPIPCRLRRKGKALTVKLPPVGAAGVLRLSR